MNVHLDLLTRLYSENLTSSDGALNASAPCRGVFTLEAVNPVSVLFARSDSVYKSLPGCDVWDIDRNAALYAGNDPVFAHPPCRGWGRLRHFSNHTESELDLARQAVGHVRNNSGVLEHPAGSTLWSDQNLPAPGAGHDEFGGWTFPVYQCWFGHRAEKSTWLYICGVTPSRIPPFELSISPASHVCETRQKVNPRPSITKIEREATPLQFALWLVNLAVRCGDDKFLMSGGRPDVVTLGLSVLGDTSETRHD